MATKHNTINDVNLTTALGGAPAAADTVYISKFSTPFSAGLDLSANKVALFQITPQSQCEFRLNGGLVLEADEFINGGSGSRLIVSSSSSAGDLTVFVNSPALGSAVTELGPCLTTAIVNTAGVLYVRETVDTSGDLEVLGGEVQVEYSATLLIDGTFRVTAGVARLSRRAETLELSGGTTRLGDSRATQGDLLITGGTTIIEDSGTLDSIDLRGGTLDLSRLSRPLTVTAWTERPGATVIMSRRAPAVTKTSSSAPYGAAQVQYVD